MDWDDFRAWALADRGRALATVYYNVGRLQSLERQGLDVTLFLSSSTAAKKEGRRIIADLKWPKDGRKPKLGHAIRTYQKALNWLVDYARTLHPDQVFEDITLDPEPPSEAATVPDERVPDLWWYTCRDPYLQAFRRAVAWVAYWTRLRRSEVARILDDADGMDQDNQVVRVEDTAKRGAPREVVVPYFFWDEGLPLGDYRAVRLPVKGSRRLFTLPDGRRLKTPVVREATGADVYDQLVSMGKDLGLRLNFIRTRRSSSSAIDGLGIHPRTGAHQLGQASADRFEHYTRKVTAERARRELQRIAPGVYVRPGTEAAPQQHTVNYAGRPEPPGLELADRFSRRAVASSGPEWLNGAPAMVLQRDGLPAATGTTVEDLVAATTGPDPLPENREPTPMPTTLLVKKGAMQRAKPVVLPIDPVSLDEMVPPSRQQAARELDGQAADPAQQAPASTAGPTKTGGSTFTHSAGVAPDGARPLGVVPLYPASRQVSRSSSSRMTRILGKNVSEQVSRRA